MPALSFSFAKKAEPKRVVAALSTKPKPDEGKEEITSLEEGEVKIDGAVQAAKALTIPCKNPLEAAKQAAAKPKAKAAAAPPPPIDEEKGGLIVRNMEKLSEDDAEAMKALLQDASREADGGGGDGDSYTEAAPILMRAGSKQAREGDAAPDISRDAFERVPVEAFGMALLRGMGYDPDKHKTRPVYHDKPRDNLLGLGAKALLPSEKMGPAGAKKKAAPKAAEAAKEEPPEKRQRQEAKESAQGAPQEQKKIEEELWPSRGLVVRIINQSSELKDFFGAEAVVLEVDAASRRCKVKARSTAGGKSQVLPGLKVSDIETRVSRDCQSVRIVRGSKRGLVAKLLQRDTKNGKAQVELEGAQQTLPLDDVCQFMA
eukprot:TRINITY_DN75738_c0_g1_i1.p1 TRINITY_DN75738_c0_g1~~TRINITY_DN75738_c0_g1_i1.p1  ORF type:complete len:373 (+),score=122.51 TRINITY_DN75738_c0_g1_i1:26-1144(+)